MSDFYLKEINDFIENGTCLLLNQTFDDVIFKRNNLKSNDLDLFAVDKTEKIIGKFDVQYSFIQNNKFYFDFLSAGFSKKNKTSKQLNNEIENINNLSELINFFKEEIEVKKDGKWFNNELSGVFYYLIFDKDRPSIKELNKEYFKKLKNENKVYFTYISFKDFYKLLSLGFDDKNNDVLKIKFNNKEKAGINEKHLSAYIEVDLIKIKNLLNIHFYKNRDDIS